MSELHLSDLIGNKSMRTQLTIAHGAARLHNRAMHHMLFSGLCGCGKTTTAKAVSLLSDAPFFEISAESIKTAENLAALFRKLPGAGYDDSGNKVGEINPAIIFIDEAHRLTLKSEEMLGIAMENFKHTYTEGRGAKKRSVTVWVPEFTLICATTKEGELSKPFRDRFKFNLVFGSYSLEESKRIVELHAKKSSIAIDSQAVEAIARRGRGTPRILVRYLDACHDFVSFMNKERITLDIVDAQCELQGIDEIGLTSLDIIILKELSEAESPQGLDSLAVKTNLDPRTIVEVNEPYLILLGFIERTKGGRIITERGFNHLVKSRVIQGVESTNADSRVISKTGHQG